MTWKTRTRWIMAIATVALIAWDILVANTPEQDDTISEQIQILARSMPILPWAWGVLTAHLFVTRSWTKRSLERWRYAAVSIIAAGISVYSLAARHVPGGIAFWLAAGFVCGWLFWPQYKENFR